MSSKKHQIPSIRFEGFTNAWEQRKLGEIAKMYQPQTITGSDFLDKGIPVFGANGYIGFYSESNHDENQVTISARGEGTGTPSYVVGPVWITGNSMVVNVDGYDIDKYFLYSNLSSKSLKKFVTGGAQPQLTREVLVKVPIIFPDTEEQSKIGAFFNQLDNTIALHQRQLDNYKELKKVMLQKIFNQELRFKDHDGNDYPNWKEKKLGGIAKYTNGKSNEGNVLENGKYNLINLNSISIDGKLKNVHKSTDIVTVLLKKDDLVMILSDVGHGDLLGRVAVIPENEKYVLNQRVAGLSVVKLVNPTYLYYFINFHQKYFKLMGKGMAQLNISKGDVEDFVVQLPYEDEQHKIADLLSTIDKQLETVEQTVELLKEQKKGLMQRMFV